MPKTVTLDDGTEEEVYTKEEVEGYQKGSDKNKERKEELSQLREKLEVGEDGKIIDSISELKENANPNFAKFRKKHTAMEKELKEKGVTLDDDGNIIDGEARMTSEEVQAMVDKGVDLKLSGNAEENALAQFEGEDKKLVKHYLDKLIPTGGTLEENLELAISKAFPSRDVNDIKLSISSNGGGRPAMQKSGKPKAFTDTPEGMAMLQKDCPAGYEVKVVDGKHKMVKKTV